MPTLVQSFTASIDDNIPGGSMLYTAKRNLADQLLKDIGYDFTTTLIDDATFRVDVEVHYELLQKVDR